MLFDIGIESVLSFPKVQYMHVHGARFSNKRRVIFTAAISKSMALHNASTAAGTMKMNFSVEFKCVVAMM